MSITALRIALLASLLVAFACVTLLSSTPMQVGPNSLPEEVPVFLDGQPFGSSSDTSQLKAHLTSLKARLPNINAGGEALPNLGALILMPNHDTSMATVSKLYEDASDAAGFQGFEKTVIGSDVACSDSNQEKESTKRIFVLSNRPMSPDDLRKARAKLYCRPTVSILNANASTNYSKRLIKSYRIAATSLEILASGTYLFNERSLSPAARVSPMANLNHPTFGRRVDSAVVRQRPIDAARLADELNTWTTLRAKEGSDDLRWNSDETVILPIIVNSKTTFSALGPVLDLIKGSNMSIAIVVDSTSI